MFRNSHFALATHVLCVLAIRDPERTSSSMLATSVNTHAAFLRGLIGQLKAAGLVEVTLGKGGGARLARPAASISLLEVWRAVEPEPTLPTHARAPYEGCPVGCHILDVLAEVEAELDAAVAARLARTRVSELAETIRTRA